MWSLVLSKEDRIRRFKGECHPANRCSTICQNIFRQLTLFRPMSFVQKYFSNNFKVHMNFFHNLVLYDLCPKIFRPQLFGTQVFSPFRFSPKMSFYKYFKAVQYFVHAISSQRYFVPLLFVYAIFCPHDFSPKDTLSLYILNFVPHFFQK